MARFSMAINAHATSSAGNPTTKEADCKRPGSDSQTDDVYISWEASTVKTVAHLKALIATMMNRLASGGHGLT